MLQEYQQLKISEYQNLYDRLIPKSASEDENIHQLMRFFLSVVNSSSENHSFFSGLALTRRPFYV